VSTLSLITTGGTTLPFEPRRLVIAGYTGRDRAAVEAHILELADEGIAPPPRVPTYFELDPELVTTAAELEVSGARTSGEAEPVLLFTRSGLFLTVGSDHTDRDLERVDIAASKAACPKPISRHVVEWSGAEGSWDEGQLRSWAGGAPYQAGELASVTPPDSLVEDLSSVLGPPSDGLVLFLGTVPLLRGTFAFEREYRVQLALPGQEVIEHDYHVSRRI
jgi:4-hydroxyphenylacetate 3-monooxygenase